MKRLFLLLLLASLAATGTAVAAEKKSMEETYIVVDSALRTGMPEIALAELKKMTPERSDAVYWLYMGRTLRMLKRPQEAVEAFGNAIERDAGSAAAYDGLGMAYGDAGDFVQAEQQLVKATELAPMEPEYHHDLAKIYLMQKQYEKAREPLSIALRIGGDRDVAKHLAFAMTLSGDEMQAKALLMKYFDLHEVYCFLGEAYELGGRIPEAVKRYQMSLMARSDYHRAQERLKRLIGEEP